MRDALGGVLATHYILPEGLAVSLGGVLATHIWRPVREGYSTGDAGHVHYSSLALL